MTGQNQFMTNGSAQMALPDAWPSKGNHIDRLFKERSLLQALDLQLERRGKALQIEGAKGLFQRQAALAQQAFCPSLMADGFFPLRSFMQIDFMREAFLGRFQSQVGETARHAGEFEAVQERMQVLVTIDGVRHSSSLME